MAVRCSFSTCISNKSIYYGSICLSFELITNTLWAESNHFIDCFASILACFRRISYVNTFYHFYLVLLSYTFSIVLLSYYIVILTVYIKGAIMAYHHFACVCVCVGVYESEEWTSIRIYIYERTNIRVSFISFNSIITYKHLVK